MKKITMLLMCLPFMAISQSKIIPLTAEIDDTPLSYGTISPNGSIVAGRVSSLQFYFYNIASGFQPTLTEVGIFEGVNDAGVAAGRAYNDNNLDSLGNEYENAAVYSKDDGVVYATLPSSLYPVYGNPQSSFSCLTNYGNMAYGLSYGGVQGVGVFVPSKYDIVSGLYETLEPPTPTSKYGNIFDAVIDESTNDEYLVGWEETNQYPRSAAIYINGTNVAKQNGQSEVMAISSNHTYAVGAMNVLPYKWDVATGDTTLLEHVGPINNSLLALRVDNAGRVYGESRSFAPGVGFIPVIWLADGTGMPLSVYLAQNGIDAPQGYQLKRLFDVSESGDELLLDFQGNSGRFTGVLVMDSVVYNAKLDSIRNATSIETYKANFEINLFPNPTSNELVIDLGEINSNEVSGISILDLAGKVVYQLTEISTNSITVNVANLPKGQYIVNVETHNGKEVHKMVKM